MLVHEIRTGFFSFLRHVPGMFCLALLGRNDYLLQAVGQESRKSDIWLKGLFRDQGSGSALGILLIVLVLICLVHLVTLNRSPAVWIDEVMILEYGRVLANPTTAWSITTTDAGVPAAPMAPLYSLIAWYWTAAFGYSPVVSRMLAMACACGACIAMYRFLRELDIADYAGAVVALAFFVDIVASGSFRGARADLCAIGCVLFGCLIWLKSLRSRVWWRAATAGVVTAVGWLVWPTAVVTSLVAAALLVREIAGRKRGLIPQVCYYLLGLAIPLACTAWWYNVYDLFSRVYLPGGVSGASISNVDLVAMARTLYGCYRFTPWVLIWVVVAIITLLRKRSDLWVTFMIICATIVVGSLPPFYRWRVVYLSPLFYITIAVAFANRMRIRFLVWGLLLPSLMVSVFGRFVTTMVEWQGRDYEVFVKELKELVPDGSTVLMDGYTAYYAGLRGGWKMYPFGTSRGLDKSVIYLVLENESNLRKVSNTSRIVGEAKTDGRKVRTAWRASYHVRVLRYGEKNCLTDMSDKDMVYRGNADATPIEAE